MKTRLDFKLAFCFPSPFFLYFSLFFLPFSPFPSNSLSSLLLLSAPHISSSNLILFLCFPQSSPGENVSRLLFSRLRLSTLMENMTTANILYEKTFYGICIFDNGRIDMSGANKNQGKFSSSCTLKRAVQSKKSREE